MTNQSNNSGSNDMERLLQLSQLEALKSLSLLLVREINSIKELQSTLEKEIEGEQPICLAQELQRFEVNMIRCALIRSMGRQNKAAHLLGLKITTLCEKIKRYNIELVV